MKAVPPMRAPAILAGRQAQKMASCVDGRPGRRLVAAMPCSKSSRDPAPSRHAQFAQQRDVRGWPPNPMQPMLPHSRRTVLSPTGWSEACSLGWLGARFERRPGLAHAAGLPSARRRRVGEFDWVPEGSSMRICWPPGPLTMSCGTSGLRAWRSTSVAMSSNDQVDAVPATGCWRAAVGHRSPAELAGR